MEAIFSSHFCYALKRRAGSSHVLGRAVALAKSTGGFGGEA